MERSTARMSFVSLAVCALGVLVHPAHAGFAYDIQFTGTFTGTENIVKLADGDEQKFRHDFTNTGTEIDSYTMSMTVQHVNGDDLSFIWTMCTTKACVLPGVETVVGLAPGESDTVTVKIVPDFDQEGSSIVTLNFHSSFVPSMSSSFSYSVIREGADILIIDDDGEAALEEHVLAGLAKGTSSYGVYDTSVQPLADASFGFDDHEYVIYLSGDSSKGTIDAADGAVLGAYLDAGGRLVASGQDLFDDISGSAFCDTYLGASRASQTSETAIDGIADDPLGDGLSFSIDAGAMNQVSQDVLDGATAAFSYKGGATAGVRRETSTYKTISLGFGLEALAPADVAAFLDAARLWFDAKPAPSRTVSWGGVKSLFADPR